MDSRYGFVVVFNPKAGSGRTYDVLRQVTSRLDGRIAPVVETRLDATFAPTLRAWVRDVRSETGRPPIVVAVGGDGTLSIALNALETPDDGILAVAPCGSGNDFASAIALADPNAAIDALETGEARRIDFGIVNERRFANCVGMGLDAEVAARAAALRRRGYPARASYYAAALIGLFFVKPVGIRVEANGEIRNYPNGVFATASNGPRYGGGFLNAPNARLDDGALDAYVYSNVNGALRRISLMQRIRAGTHTSHPDVTSLRSASLVVEFDRDVAMQVDGETTTVRRANIAIVPLGMQVLAPPSLGDARTR